MGNWADAIRAVLDALVCTKCGACNRPGAHVIEVQDGHAICGVCAYAWPVRYGA